MKVIKVLQDGVVFAKFYAIPGMKIDRLAEELIRIVENPFSDYTTEESEEKTPKS